MADENKATPGFRRNHDRSAGSSRAARAPSTLGDDIVDAEYETVAERQRQSRPIADPPAGGIGITAAVPGRHGHAARRGPTKAGVAVRRAADRCSGRSASALAAGRLLGFRRTRAGAQRGIPSTQAAGAAPAHLRRHIARRCVRRASGAVRRWRGRQRRQRSRRSCRRSTSSLPAMTARVDPL